MANPVAPKIEFKNRLVAFVDIMGFRELLKNADNSTSLLQKYYDTLYKHLGEKSEAFAKYHPEHQFDKLVVSDAIVLSVVLEGTNEEKTSTISNFMRSIGLLQYVLAFECDVWTRGAITAGKLFIDGSNNLLVGPAFVKAFELEKDANYPRLIVDASVWSELDQNPHQFIEAVNGHDYELMGGAGSNRLGRIPFTHDAVQIDWFRHAFPDSNRKIDIFFDGLDRRLKSNHEIMQKCWALLRYIRESCDDYRSRGAPETSKFKAIDQRLVKVGF